MSLDPAGTASDGRLLYSCTDCGARETDASPPQLHNCLWDDPTTPSKHYARLTPSTTRPWFEPGDRVRWTDAFKAKLRGDCQHPNVEDSEMCGKCSLGHLLEFESQVGVVKGRRFHDYPELTVLWPDNLWYTYPPSGLEKVP